MRCSVYHQYCPASVSSEILPGGKSHHNMATSDSRAVKIFKHGTILMPWEADVMLFARRVCYGEIRPNEMSVLFIMVIQNSSL